MAYTLMLKEIRQSRGINQKEMAERLCMPLSTYRTWEQGVSRISLETAYELAKLLDCTPNDLCGWYIDHPEDAPGAVGGRADPRRQAMVDAYDALTDDGKTLASETVASLARDPLRRADAAGAGSAGPSPQEPAKELIA